jgi:phage tail tape-measure protein
VAGRVFKPLGAAVDVYEIGSAIYKDGGIGSNTKQVATDAVVGWAKTAAGAGIGAAIGSVVPVLGTGVGAVVGGIVGSFL